MEIFWTGLSSLFNGNAALIAHSSIWMILIYGMAIFLEPIQNMLKNKNLLIRGSIYMIAIYIGEYITGFLLDILGIKVWEYTDKLNIHGYITLTFIPLWFAAGLLFERVKLWLDKVSEVDTELKVTDDM